VIFFCLPEAGAGQHPSHDWLAECAGGVQIGDALAGGALLLVRIREDDAAVLRAPVRSLAIQLRGIMQRKNTSNKVA